MITKDKQVLKDPLKETTLPNIFNLFDINHWSATQGTITDGPWFYRYGVCDQKIRRQFDGNAKMAAGVAVNNAIQYHLANKIFKINPATGKLAPFDNTKLSLEDANQKVLEEFKEYKSVNEKDQICKDRYLETIPLTILQLSSAVETLGISGNIIAENTLSFHDDRLHLPTVGRSDLEFGSGFSSSAVHHSPTGPFGLIEIKTSWDRVSKQKKDGSWSFVNAKVPLVPSRNHLLQCAFYKACKPEHEVKLIYVVKDDFVIFDKNNCQDLTDENLISYYEQLIKVFERRERLLMRYDNYNDVDLVIAELVKDIDPDFSHPYLWSIGSMYVKAARELWNC